MNSTVKTICATLSSKMAEDIKVIDVGSLTSVADYFVIASGRSVTQVKALYEAVDEVLEKQNSLPVIRREGNVEGRWIAMDYGDIVVHIFHKEAREVYQLDLLWNNGDNVTEYVD